MVFASVFALVVGAGMIGQWLFFLATGQVPELKTEPLRIRFHLAAEFATAMSSWRFFPRLLPTRDSSSVPPHWLDSVDVLYSNICSNANQG